MRIKEWYGWHFPELSKMVPGSKSYIELVKLIQVFLSPNQFHLNLTLQDRSKIQKDIAPKIEEIVLDEGLAQSIIIQMAECSMGCEISQEDMVKKFLICYEIFKNRSTS